MQPAPRFGAWLLLALATVASPAIARGGHGHGDRGHHHDKSWHDNGRHGRDRHDDGRWDDHRVTVYSNSYAVYRNRYPVYRNSGYGAGYYVPAPLWPRGARYYEPGYGPTYVVTDYGAHGLRYPPTGYGWRRDARGDFLLVWLASGVIVDLILHGGY